MLSSELRPSRAAAARTGTLVLPSRVERPRRTSGPESPPGRPLGALNLLHVGSDARPCRRQSVAPKAPGSRQVPGGLEDGGRTILLGNLDAFLFRSPRAGPASWACIQCKHPPQGSGVQFAQRTGERPGKGMRIPAEKGDSLGVGDRRGGNGERDWAARSRRADSKAGFGSWIPPGMRLSRRSKRRGGRGG